MPLSPQSEFIERSLDNIAELFKLSVNKFALLDARLYIRERNVTHGFLPLAVCVGDSGQIIAVYSNGYHISFSGDGGFSVFKPKGKHIYEFSKIDPE